jgi:thioredoxin-like negative regulator of GroEL
VGISTEETSVHPVQLIFVTRRTSGVGRRMESVVASLQSRNRDRIAIRTVDADDDADLVAQLGVQEVPALVFLHGERNVVTLEGRATLEELEHALDACA